MKTAHGIDIARNAPPAGIRRACRVIATMAVLAVVAGCASRQPGRDGRDGPDPNPPGGLAQRPDAQPRVEPLRVGGPNKPYEVFGQRYVPMTSDQPLVQSGLASWYGRKFHGLPTSSGEPYDMYAMTAAHTTMPIPSYARVRNPANGREIVVRINDRGPFSPGRVIDLSYTAALKLGVLAGVAPVQVVRLTHDDIRAAGNAALASAAASPQALSMSLPVPAPAIAQADPLPAPAATPPLAIPLPIDDPAPGDAPSRAAPGLWLQIGAFRNRDGAEQLQQRALRQVDGLPAVAVFDEGGLFRVQAGPFASRADALDALDRLRRQLGALPLLVERR